MAYHRYLLPRVVFATILSAAAVTAAVSAGSVTVAVNPSSVTLRLGDAKSFSAAVSNTTNKGVAWFVNGIAGGNGTVGIVDGTGKYQTPTAVPTPNVVTVSAASKADATKTGVATVTLLNPIPVISSLSVTQINTQLPFVLSVTGSSFLPTATVALDDGTALSIKSQTATLITVAGTTQTAAGKQIHLTVTNPGSGSSTSSPRTINVVSPVAVTVSPTAKSLRAGSSLTLVAKVSNNPVTTVTWSLSGADAAHLGSITSAGVYTAPAVLGTAPTVTVTATSAADPSKSASATLTLLNPVPVITSVTSPVTAGPAVALTIGGSGFAPSAKVMAAGTSLAVTWTSTTGLTAVGNIAPTAGGIVAVKVINPDPGGLTSQVYPVTVNNPGSRLSYAAAKRFLEQATWGPTPAGIAHLQDIGVDAWLAEQFNPALTPVSQYAQPLDCTTGLGQLQLQFFNNALTGADQLRQRVAFALGQIAVVSGVKLPKYCQMQPYQQLLLNDAFETYHAFLKDVTLSPSMGHYLDMVNNSKATPTTSPDENYARELMQLFSIGLAHLNSDGSTDSPPVPTYSEDDVRALARVFTGWTYPDCLGASKWPNSPCFNAPMTAFEEHHDNAAKVFLGATINAGSAEGDLDAALAAIESYSKPGALPNVAPFVALRLIQHLVTSNPSPGYVTDVAAVFASTDGSLQAVVKAILTHPEAGFGNGGAALPANQGHLREPVLYSLALLRALNASYVYGASLDPSTTNMGQDLFNAPSVFNYYSPFYHLPGTPTVAPEFQILSQTAAFARASFAYRASHNQISQFIFIDWSNWEDLASDTNPATQTASLTNLLNAVSRALLGAPMSTDMLNAIMPALVVTQNAGTRVMTAVYLVAVSSQYQVQR